MADEVGQVFKTQAVYEKMTHEELSEEYSDADIKLILQRVYGLDSVVYFIDKAQKLTYITQPDQRPNVLEAGEAKRSVHRDANRENRATPRLGVAERMEEETKDRFFRFVGSVKRQTTDSFTGRLIRMAYVIKDLSDGAQYDVSRGSCRWLVEKGRLEGFTAAKGRKSVAHSAGLKSAADLLGEEPGATVSNSVPEVAVTEEKAEGAISDEELDELLNTLSD